MQSLRRRFSQGFFQAKQTLYDEDQYVRKTHRSTFLWSLLGVLAFLVVWFTIPYVINLSDPVELVLPSKDDLSQPSSTHVLRSEIDSVHWREKVGYALSTMEEACEKYHYVSLTNHNVMFNGERLRDSLVYVCSMKRGFLNMKIHEKGMRDVRCNERYASIRRPVVRASHIEVEGIDASTFENVKFTVEDPKSSCVIQQAHSIMLSTWSI